MRTIGILRSLISFVIFIPGFLGDLPAGQEFNSHSTHFYIKMDFGT